VIDAARIESALDYIAQCIAAGDESLLPIFERLDKELEERQKENPALAKALARVNRAKAGSAAQPAM
jgi:aminopeptidase-like protein